ncbi:hypothetical protein JJL45_09195 [Tamlana sp. s12]|uniref:hypothetical protein n=1 Tax=Tamlana sp. s12 TaxID=1630406 RepID=UPI0007FBD3DF|nr:hypothetical protein [Tamlana sp. s12]OBQ52869.1 hypothetical protein VQ01_13050 [Tamlana sp. s12]QQY81105.1 hypothetical protein JJL45_09195 [Tamlana sp. s12]
MAKLEIKTPKKPQIINAGATTVGAIAGYQGYEMVAHNLPVSKEMNLGILGGSILAQSMVRGSGMMHTIAQALLLGVTVCAGQTAIEDYNLISLSKSKTVVPVVSDTIEIAETAEALNALYGGVEYIQDAEYTEVDMS